MASSIHDKFDELVVDFIKETRFKIKKFKPEQQLVLKSFFSSRDVFAQLPTGYGKSLVFQCIPDMYIFFKRHGFSLPADDPVVIVACPLQAIIVDQITKLNSIGVHAVDIGDPSSNGNLLSGDVRIIFGSPESLGTETSRRLLTTPFYRKNIVALVSDEVHTVTQW